MRISRQFATLLVATVFGLGLTACEKKGPAEKAGEQVDQALGTQDKGPAEKAGENLDQAAQKVEEAADELKK